MLTGKSKYGNYKKKNVDEERIPRKRDLHVSACFSCVHVCESADG